MVKHNQDCLFSRFGINEKYNYKYFHKIFKKRETVRYGLEKPRRLESERRLNEGKIAKLRRLSVSAIKGRKE